MERFRNFDIHFIGLKNGVTVINYDIESQFFGLFEKSPITTGRLSVRLKFDKKESFFMLKFEVDGIINIACDRCSDFFDYEIMFDFDMLVKYGEAEDKFKDEGEVMYIERGVSHFNIAEVIYDYTLINIPIQVIHPNDVNGKPKCNPAILEKLSKNTHNQIDEIDPRWALLNKLKN
jgi:uncharacterized metal-binding protein YceD (DUF177 family)